MIGLGVAACGGARHRKVAGPPPEYEAPDEPAAAGAEDAGPPADAGGTNFMLISPDGRR